MSRNSLPDELRSVLLQHSFDAPDADDTITRILADTVSQQLAGRRPNHRQLAAGLTAAAVIVLGLGGVGIAKLHHDAGSASSASRGSVNSPAPAFGSQDHNNKGMNLAPLPGGQGLASGSTSIVVPDNLSCATTPGGKRLYTQLDDIRLNGQTDQVVAAQCVSANGVRTSSQVYVVAEVSGIRTIRATVIPQSAGISVVSLAGGSDQFSVEYLRLATAGAPESLQRQTFRTTDGGASYQGSATETVAQACRAKILAASLAGEAGGRYRLQVRNSSGSACVLTGYPSLAGGTQTLRGPAGGTRAELVPVLTLAPGAVATAAAEPLAPHQPCPAVAKPVRLPDGSALSAGAPCVGQVHPFVAGSSGSD